MVYCGFCGNPLQSAALAKGQCPTCGATISPDGHVIFPGNDTFYRGDTREANALTLPEQPAIQRNGNPPVWPSSRPDSPRSSIPASLLVAISLLTLATFIIVGVLVTRSGRLGSQSRGTIPTSTARTSASTTLTPAGLTGTATSTAGATPTVTATAEVTATTTLATSTATPAPPILDVQPTTINVGACLVANKAMFTITNQGGSTLNWDIINSSTGYTVSPSSGSLGAGGSTTVTLTTIHQTGQVVVDAPGAQNAPVTVTITCGILP